LGFAPKKIGLLWENIWLCFGPCSCCCCWDFNLWSGLPLEDPVEVLKDFYRVFWVLFWGYGPEWSGPAPPFCETPFNPKSGTAHSGCND